MLMCLCLLVYSIAQRQLRQALAASNESIPNQINKATKTPTLKWIAQIFEGVHVVYLKINNQLILSITNLDDLRIKILTLLGFSYLKIYQLAN